MSGDILRGWFRGRGLQLLCCHNNTSPLCLPLLLLPLHLLFFLLLLLLLLFFLLLLLFFLLLLLFRLRCLLSLSSSLLSLLLSLLPNVPLYLLCSCLLPLLLLLLLHPLSSSCWFTIHSNWPSNLSWRTHDMQWSKSCK